MGRTRAKRRALSPEEIDLHDEREINEYYEAMDDDYWDGVPEEDR